jgi:hypothetical protein
MEPQLTTHGSAEVAYGNLTPWWRGTYTTPLSDTVAVDWRVDTTVATALSRTRARG